MLILALDTITRGGSLALRDAGVLHARDGADERTHAERLPAEALEWLGRHGRTLADVDLFAVLSGPGSFTGIRVGMAAAQGLSLASHRRVIGIPSLEAVATTWLMRADAAPDSDAPGQSAGVLLIPCIDAARAQVFFAGFEVDDATNPDRVPTLAETAIESLRCVIPPAVGSPAELAALASQHAGHRRVIIVGDGAARYAEMLGSLAPGIETMAPPMPLAGAAAIIAERRQAEAGAPHALRPIYLRRPDVELARERRAQDAGRSVPPVLTFARASFDDIPAVERLQGQTFTNPWGAAAIRWELENTDVARLYVARSVAGATIGYCACWIVFDELHINSLAVDQAWRRKGVATRLLEHVMEDARRAGATAATLEVRSSNESARKLYEGLRFSIEGVRRDYYQHPREDALILWRRDLRG